jgi:hypothetical protein
MMADMGHLKMAVAPEYTVERRSAATRDGRLAVGLTARLASARDPSGAMRQTRFAAALASTIVGA